MKDLYIPEGSIELLRAGYIVKENGIILCTITGLTTRGVVASNRCVGLYCDNCLLYAGNHDEAYNTKRTFRIFVQEDKV